MDTAAPALARRPRAALIDLDGTLLDTVDDIAAAGNAMLAEAGKPALARETVAAYVGKGSANFVARALAGSLDASASPGDPAVARWLPVFLRHYERDNGRAAQLFPQVREGLAALRAAGLALAVVTNKPRAPTLSLLDQFGLRGAFDAVVAGGDTARGKPDAEPLLHACKLLGVASADALMIGDSLNDVQAARAAGCPVLVLPYGYNEGRPVRTLASDGIVATLLDAARLIEALPAHLDA